MKKIPAWLLLCIISLVAGLALGFTNALTKDEIARQDEASNEEARKKVMSEADEFVQLDVAADSGVDYCYEAKKGGETIGYVAKATADGYGGKIEVTVGIDNNGMITGISCGGSGFSETPGLGAKVKEAKFSDQFAGMSAPVSITKDGGQVDSITAASRSSRAVCKAVNAACDYVAAMCN